MHLTHRFKSYKSKFFVSASVLALAVGVGVFGLSTQKTLAADAGCNGNSIVYCGTGTASQFISKVKANSDGAPYYHHDLQGVYAHFGLEPADYDKFVSSAVPGTVNANGTVTVNGQVVANNDDTLGRYASWQNSNYFTTYINGKAYYGNTVGKANYGGDYPVMVMFNAQGKMQFAVMTSCGNPVWGSPVTPTYSCNALHKTAVAGQLNTYDFSTAASAGNNASIAKVVYNFGDGTTVTEASPTTVVRHTYSKAGTFKATVTVYVHLPGNQTVTVTSVNCETTITVLAPYYSCLQLTDSVLDKSKFSYSFTATARFGNGATFTGADFNFGDGTNANGVKASGVSASTTHAYAKAGSYNATATLHFLANGVAESATCSVKVSPTPLPYYACVQLVGAVVDQSKYSYSFTATASFGNGATFSGADFNFGDGKTVTNVKPNGNTVATTHTYAAAGTYNVAATLHFNANNAVQSVKCYVGISPTQPPVSQCLPGIPMGSSQCYCQYNQALPANSPQCAAPTAPTQLVNTGPGSAAAIFAGVLAVAFLVYWQFIRRRTLNAAAADAAAASLGHHLATGSHPMTHETEDGAVIGHMHKPKK